MRLPRILRRKPHTPPPAKEAWVRLLNPASEVVAEGPVVLVAGPNGSFVNVEAISWSATRPETVSHVMVQTMDGVQVLPVAT